MSRYVCIHGHFYQPPRENPWLESIELQDSAYPFHDWNERITAQCYAPNAASRILAEDGRIAQIVNNYAKISFNIGPTLLSWLEAYAPETYAAILRADAESQARFSGHGSAMAQAYNHAILPLCNRRDKETQVRWGVYDFERRFRRAPEGMWLPEAAVDLETLEILVDHGIKFTVLSPYSAKQVSGAARGETQRDGGEPSPASGEGEPTRWHDVGGGRVDPSRAYWQRLPSGRKIALFFYDAPISQAVAFESLLESGERFVARLISGFSRERAWPELVHIATDGETYGHHHALGDMALAYALHKLESTPDVQLTNYGEYLARHPPECEVEIFENTAWSCAHGVERWRGDCGCNVGHRQGWNQAWRAPLRQALDWLRDALAGIYAEHAGRLLKDPWAARDGYAAVICDRSPAARAAFFAAEARHPLDESEIVQALQLLEMQRNAMLMYTSCGWFFDELSGIETVQIIQYAARALQLAERASEAALLEGFLSRLAAAKSNLPELGDGRQIYERFVRPAMVDLVKVCAHFALSALFEPYSEETQIYCYKVTRHDSRTMKAGHARVVVGKATIVSEITRVQSLLSYGVLHMGDHYLSGGVRRLAGDEADDKTLEALQGELAEPFTRADFPEVIRLMDRHFGGMTFALRSLFRDEQRKVLRGILKHTLGEIESVYAQIFERHFSLIRFHVDLGIPPPRALLAAGELALNRALREAIEAPAPSAEEIDALLVKAKNTQAALDQETLSFAWRQTLWRLAGDFAQRPRDLGALNALQAAVDMARRMPFSIALFEVQNVFFQIYRRDYRELARAAGVDGQSGEWIMRFRALGEKLSICLD